MENFDNNEQVTIVIVDDEQMVLTSLSSFFMLETDYNIVEFTSAKEALNYIENNDIDLVISDQMMPEMDGISFLKKVRAIQPAVPRYLLTGYADKENAIQAINHVALDKYIQKPWDNEKLADLVDNDVKKRNIMKMFERKINEINDA
ncbi:MAG: response regulator, partial [bacterium]